MTTTATPLSTITTTDQNTQRTITWNVDHVIEHGANTRSQYGWTHLFMLSRPKGRVSYVVHVELIGDVVVRQSRPTKAF